MNIFESPYDIYTIATGFVLALSFVEIMLFVFGSSLSKIFSNELIVEKDLIFDKSIDFNLEHNFEIDNLNLFNIGKVPFFLILVSLAGIFGFTGIGSHILAKYLNISINNLFIFPFSVLTSIIGTYVITNIWSKLIPNYESYVIKQKELIGQVGNVVIGSGDISNLVEVSIIDKYNKNHFFMCRVLLENIKVNKDDRVRIINYNLKNKEFEILPLMMLEKIDENEK